MQRRDTENSRVRLNRYASGPPTRIGTLIIGLFYLSISVGDCLSGRLASVYGTVRLPALFDTAGISALALGVILALLNKLMNRLSGPSD